MSRSRPKNNRVPRDRRTSRSAFTLLELLIVLAMLGSLAAIAWPSVHRLIGRSSQGDAALQLAADITDAREEAIRTGESREVRIAPGTGRYRIRRVMHDKSAISSRAESSIDSPMEPPADLVEHRERTAAPASIADPSDSFDAEVRELPGGVIFAPAHSDDDVGQEPGMDAPPNPTLELDPELGEPSDARYQFVASLFPDGRSTDTVMELTSPDTTEITTVRLRGWTGGITIRSVRPPRDVSGSESGTARPAYRDRGVDDLEIRGGQGDRNGNGGNERNRRKRINGEQDRREQDETRP